MQVTKNVPAPITPPPTFTLELSALEMHCLYRLLNTSGRAIREDIGDYTEQDEEVCYGLWSTLSRDMGMDSRDPRPAA